MRGLGYDSQLPFAHEPGDLRLLHAKLLIPCFEVFTPLTPATYAPFLIMIATACPLYLPVRNYIRVPTGTSTETLATHR